MRGMRQTGMAAGPAIALLALLGGCADDRYDVVPERLEKQINQHLSFGQIVSSPDRYKGKLVVLGGEVLSATRLEDRTEVEILQLPLTEDHVPSPERVYSQGRFVAFDEHGKITDPAILQKGTPITVVGEVTGSRKGTIGKSTYQYPTLSMRDMTIWSKDITRRPPYPYWAYGGYYWYTYRPYYWPYY